MSAPNKYQFAIQQARTGETAKGDNFVVYPTIDTTMNAIDAAIAEGKPNGYTAIALQQTAGIGTSDPTTGKSRTWWSESTPDLSCNNVLFSRIVEIEPDEHAKMIELIAALSTGNILRRILQSHNKDSLSLQWKCPNDVLIDGAKIAGHLGRVHPCNQRYINLGVGVNIALTPPDSAKREKSAVKALTSLPELGVNDYELASFMTEFDTEFATQLAAFRQDKNFVAVLEAVGFAQTYTGLITIQPPGHDVVSGHFEGFETRANEHGVMVNYIKLQSQAGLHEFLYRDLYIHTSSPAVSCKTGPTGPQNG